MRPVCGDVAISTSSTHVSTSSAAATSGRKRSLTLPVALCAAPSSLVRARGSRRACGAVLRCARRAVVARAYPCRCVSAALSGAAEGRTVRRRTTTGAALAMCSPPMIEDDQDREREVSLRDEWKQHGADDQHDVDRQARPPRQEQAGHAGARDGEIREPLNVTSDTPCHSAISGRGPSVRARNVQSVQPYGVTSVAAALAAAIATASDMPRRAQAEGLRHDPHADHAKPRDEAAVQLAQNAISGGASPATRHGRARRDASTRAAARTRDT